MKKFLFTVTCFVVALFAVNLLIDIYVSKQLQLSKDRRYVGWNEIVHREIDADMVIMGSSRAWVQYDPAILDSILGIKVYNLGLNGSNLNRQIIKYNIYSHFQSKQPHYILVNIDYHATLQWTIGYQREQFFPYMLNPYTREQILKVEPFNFAELYIPLYRYTTYKGVHEVLKDKSKNSGLKDGYKGQDKKWSGKKYGQIETYHFVTNDSTMQMFNEFLSERKTAGQQVIFCYAPIYIGLTNKVDNMQDVYDTYDSLSAKYDIQILNYMYSDLCRDTMYFYNAVHLNKRGAELFSIQLAHDLDSIGVTK